MSDNPTTPDPPANPYPDEVMPGRADFFRAASAIAAGDTDGFTQVLAELCCLHPAAWQSVIGAGVAEFVSLLVGQHGGDVAAVVDRLNTKAMSAIDLAEEVADRRGSQ